MKDYLLGAATIATGIIVACVALAALWWVAQPAAKITIELSGYKCATDGVVVTCLRR